uniref:Ubiquitin carboxyl-terminal hydrolase CYLD n=1 Tax=Takifugu rubripes TaxID=31033 RepID=H2RK57_TAKRU
MLHCGFLSCSFTKMTSDKLFFILTRKPDKLQHISAGQICHISQFKYSLSSSQKTFSVMSVGHQFSLPYDIEVGSLEELSEAEAELLLALTDDAERLKWFQQRDSLRAALELKVGMVVNVEKDGEQLRGIIRTIGRRTEPAYSASLSGTFFGIEPQRLKFRCSVLLKRRCQQVCGDMKLFLLDGSNDSNPNLISIAEPEIYQSLCTDLTVNSVVELTLDHRSLYGIIRWIGRLPERMEMMAGIELEEEVGVNDGTFRGERYFFSPPKRALFVKLSSCQPDSRFQSLSFNQSERKPKEEEQVDHILIGRMKGIQGHCNSCYMDAALFSLFSCSSVLDSMLFKSTEPEDSPIQKTLLCNIVNPLRSNGFVEGRHIMKLRQQLQKLGYSHSFTTEEKDPEEFLTIIMQQILALEPLLKLSAGGEVQECYYYQIFLDQKHNLLLPSVQQLLEHSFHTEGIKLAEVPSCLILQMPRFGKKFKMFETIVPSLELDITDLLSKGPQQCMLCGNLAQEECSDCFKDPLFSRTGFKMFCETCSAQVHTHPLRRSHQRSPLDIPNDFLPRRSPNVLARDKLDLFAVLCIETSHYVSFIKHGPSSQDWIFFDSMADRQGAQCDGFNIPEVRACPEVGAYLEMSPSELADQVPRDMRGVAKRLFCDAYMYLYQSSSMCLYR